MEPGSTSPIAFMLQTVISTVSCFPSMVIFHTQSSTPSMIDKVLLGRPEITNRWRIDASTGESEQEIWHIGIGGDLAGGDDGVAVLKSHHHLVKGPVAAFLEQHAVADIIVLTLTPGDYMDGIHHGMLLRGDDPHSAQGAAMVIAFHHKLAGLLITGCGPVIVRLQNFLHQRFQSFPLCMLRNCPSSNFAPRSCLRR